MKKYTKHQVVVRAFSEAFVLVQQSNMYRRNVSKNLEDPGGSQDNPPSSSTESLRKKGDQPKVKESMVNLYAKPREKRNKTTPKVPFPKTFFSMFDKKLSDGSSSDSESASTRKFVNMSTSDDDSDAEGSFENRIPEVLKQKDSQVSTHSLALDLEDSRRFLEASSAKASTSSKTVNRLDSFLSSAAQSSKSTHKKVDQLETKESNTSWLNLPVKPKVDSVHETKYSSKSKSIEQKDSSAPLQKQATPIVKDKIPIASKSKLINFSTSSDDDSEPESDLNSTDSLKNFISCGNPPQVLTKDNEVVLQRKDVQVSTPSLAVAPEDSRILKKGDKIKESKAFNLYAKPKENRTQTTKVPVPNSSFFSMFDKKWSDQSTSSSSSSDRESDDESKYSSKPKAIKQKDSSALLQKQATPIVKDKIPIASTSKLINFSTSSDDTDLECSNSPVPFENCMPFALDKPEVSEQDNEIVMEQKDAQVIDESDCQNNDVNDGQDSQDSISIKSDGSNESWASLEEANVVPSSYDDDDDESPIFLPILQDDSDFIPPPLQVSLIRERTIVLFELLMSNRICNLFFKG